MNNTPKKRYSCISEYATPKGSDDSDNSLYYSFVTSEDENLSNKENSNINNTSGQLIRTVLQANCTPRNKINKRVSFRSALRLNETRELIHNAQEAQPIDGSFSPNTPLSTVEESQANSSDVTDDLENELQDTVIENTSSAINNTLIQTNSEQDGKNKKIVQPSKKIGAKTGVDIKSVKPVVPLKKLTRATTYKRRSSIYEPHKLHARKSLISKNAYKQGKCSHFTKFSVLNYINSFNYLM